MNGVRCETDHRYLPGADSSVVEPELISGTSADAVHALTADTRKFERVEKSERAYRRECLRSTLSMVNNRDRSSLDEVF